MKLLRRLRLCYNILRARRAVVFIPDYPTLYLAVVGEVPPHAWEAIIAQSAAGFNQAVSAAEAHLLAELAALNAEESALDTERQQVAAGVRTTPQAAKLLAEAQALVQPKRPC